MLGEFFRYQHVYIKEQVKCLWREQCAVDHETKNIHKEEVPRVSWISGNDVITFHDLFRFMKNQTNNKINTQGKISQALAASDYRSKVLRTL